MRRALVTLRTPHRPSPTTTPPFISPHRAPAVWGTCSACCSLRHTISCLGPPICCHLTGLRACTSPSHPTPDPLARLAASPIQPVAITTSHLDTLSQAVVQTHRFHIPRMQRRLPSRETCSRNVRLSDAAEGDHRISHTVCNSKQPNIARYRRPSTSNLRLNSSAAARRTVTFTQKYLTTSLGRRQLRDGRSICLRSSSISVLRRYVVMYNLVHSVDTSH